ncbi:MAG: dienelactone hydrolase family protein [Gammaproteobacteria bacterium]
MQFKTLVTVIGYTLISLVAAESFAGEERDCRYDSRPAITFVEVQSVDLQTRQPLKVKGKLNVPVPKRAQGDCHISRSGRPAVVILHGSAGVDSRSDFYARALNAEGIATLELDMWEARGIQTPADRPPLPAYNYPDAFGALAFLSAYPGIDPDRIGVIGFSWGGVITMASATQGVANQFGGALRFRAHVAHYPICYAYNNPYIPDSQFGSHAGNPLTGAPILIQIGDKDDYDESAAPCFALKNALIAPEKTLLEVASYAGAYHDWDRLLVPVVSQDPFAHLGAGGTVRLFPSVDQAYQAQKKAVRFFLKNL